MPVTKEQMNTLPLDHNVRTLEYDAGATPVSNDRFNHDTLEHSIATMGFEAGHNTNTNNNRTVDHNTPLVFTDEPPVPPVPTGIEPIGPTSIVAENPIA